MSPSPSSSRRKRSRETNNNNDPPGDDDDDDNDDTKDDEPPMDWAADSPPAPPVAQLQQRRSRQQQRTNWNRSRIRSTPTDPESEEDEEAAEDEEDMNGNDGAGNANLDDDPQGEEVEEEEEEGEDLMDNMERDYQRIDVLDSYGTEGLDDRDYDLMDEDLRLAAERELDRRDRRKDGFYGTLLDIVETEEDEEARQARRGLFAPSSSRQRRSDLLGEEDATDEETDSDDDDLDGDDRVNLEAFDVPLREWISRDRTRREIQRKFRAFLRHFTLDERPAGAEPQQRRRKGNGIYEQKIRAMCASNLSTLQVSYMHLMQAEPILAYWLADAPNDMIPVVNEAATRHTRALFRNYGAIRNEIHVRISDLPLLDSLRDLRRNQLDCLVKVHGVVTRRSSVYPSLQTAYYTCTRCHKTQGPFVIQERAQSARAAGQDLASAGATVGATAAPDACPTVGCEATHFRLNPDKSLYRNVQRLHLQETPGSVPPGRVPRTKEVLLADDLIDGARPGEEVEVTGVFEHTFDASLTFKSGFPVFSTFITANHIRRREDASSAANLSEADVRTILDLAQDPKIGHRIAASIAPSIHGHDVCKMALAMSLFGGVPKNVNDKHRIRGDVNLLLLGDPGTAKSQLLKYAERTAPRAVYSTGKGASAVGLTASVHKDPITKEWTLEGGALVLADKGVALIDEFDKMNEQDRTSIHEAMEQQTISVSKAGIVTSLQARCAVIAAANPIGGRYDSASTLSDNVELTDPILQRFDILCVLQDIVDPVADEKMARFVTKSHMQSVNVPTANASSSSAAGGGANEQLLSSEPSIDNLVDRNNPSSTLQSQGSYRGSPLKLIPQDTLRKYIQYARTNIRPVLRGNAFDQEKVASLYVALRKESASSGGVPIAVRHIESMMRMAEAHAKMHLRDYVRDDDVDVSISMMLNSFIAAQKFSVQRSLRRAFAKFLTSSDDRAQLLLHMLQDMFRKEQMYQLIRLRQRNQPDSVLETLSVPTEELESKARERRIYDVSEFLTSQVFREAGYLLDGRSIVRNLL